MAVVYAFMARRPWRQALLWLLCLAPFFYLSYGAANFLADQRLHVPTIVFDWEKSIPFVPWTIFPYWTVNFFYGLSFFLAPTRHVLRRHGLRLLSAQVIAVTFFIAFPLRYSFGWPPAQGLAGMLFDALRAFDRPFNQAPSLHIALAVILWDFYRQIVSRQWARCLLHVWTCLIVVSVLTTYQHHFIDVATGALLGIVCVWAWPLERMLSMWQAWRLSFDAGRQKLAVAYIVGALLLAVLAMFLWGAMLWCLWLSVALLLVGLNYAGLGVRGFQMRSDGRMRWPAWWLYAPYACCARLNQWLWTRRIDAANEVLPRVWLGRLPAHGTLPLFAVVSLCAEWSVRQSIQCVPSLDLTMPSVLTLRRAARRIDAAYLSGAPVLVCCALGFSRSCGALAFWLVTRGHAENIRVALQMIRVARPEVVLNDAYSVFLQQAVSGSL